MQKRLKKQLQPNRPKRYFIVRTCNNWLEIRESYTNLRKVTSHMYIKQQRPAIKYEVTGFDSSGFPIKKRVKDAGMKTVNVKVSQSSVVGGEVVGLVAYREFYYNGLGALVPYDVGTFVEVSKEVGLKITDSTLMSKYFPSFISAKGY